MRTLTVTTVALAACLGAAHAQLPLPSEPDLGKRAQCTKDYVQSVETQVQALEQLRTAGPEAVGRLCMLVEMGSAWLGGKLPEDVRKELRSLLGHDLDLEQIVAQCRAGQDALARELTTRLAQLRSELVRCGDTI